MTSLPALTHLWLRANVQPPFDPVNLYQKVHAKVQQERNAHSWLEDKKWSFIGINTQALVKCADKKQAEWVEQKGEEGWEHTMFA